MLSQLDNQGNDKPVAFYSHKLLPREERYSVIEKECLAIKSAVQTFHPYLMGEKVRIQTDHRSLEWLNREKDSIPRLTWWSLFFQSYCFSIEYHTGHRNGNADGLSRLY